MKEPTAIECHLQQHMTFGCHVCPKNGVVEDLFSCTPSPIVNCLSPRARQDERCVSSIVAALAPLVGPEARRILAARSRPAVLLHGPATAEGGSLVEAAAERVRRAVSD